MKTVITMLTAVLASTAFSETSRIWSEWVAGKQPIPDYSWAGYRYGAEGIPDVTWKRFDVTEYGALPNDEKSDYEGIQRAIKAAEANGSGIVFFPSGKFLVGEEEGIRESILIQGANIVLRGSGRSWRALSSGMPSSRRK